MHDRKSEHRLQPITFLIDQRKKKKKTETKQAIYNQSSTSDLRSATKGCQ